MKRYYQNRYGFTVIEILIVMLVLAILTTLTVVSLRGNQASARDSERAADIQTIMRGLEARFQKGNPKITAAASPHYVQAGSYPDNNEMKHILGESVSGMTPTQVSGGYVTEVLTGTETKGLTAPGQSAISLVLSCPNCCNCEMDEGTSADATTTINTYVYEPLDVDGKVCVDTRCVRYNLYYRTEAGDTLVKVSGKR